MYRLPVIIGKISHDRRGSFSIMAGNVLYIIPLITWLLAKTKKIFHMVCLITIYLLPAFVVLISREIVRQKL